MDFDSDCWLSLLEHIRRQPNQIWENSTIRKFFSKKKKIVITSVMASYFPYFIPQSTYNIEEIISLTILVQKLYRNISRRNTSPSPDRGDR